MMDLRDLKEFFIDSIKYLVIIFIVLFTVIYVCSFQQVIGPSMEPNLNNEDILLTNKLVFRFRKPARFEVITFKHEDSTFLIKRVIGIPGDNIIYKDNTLYINGESYEETFLAGFVTQDFKLEDLGHQIIPDDMYLVLGDNREDSLDSREFALIKKEQLIGKPFVRILPFNKISLID